MRQPKNLLALKTGKLLKGHIFLRVFAQWLNPTCSLTGQLVKVLAEFTLSCTNALGTWPEANSFLSPVQCVTLPEPLVPLNGHTRATIPSSPCVLTDTAQWLSGIQFIWGSTFLWCSTALVSMPWGKHHVVRKVYVLWDLIWKWKMQQRA